MASNNQTTSSKCVQVSTERLIWAKFHRNRFEFRRARQSRTRLRWHCWGPGGAGLVPTRSGSKRIEVTR